jgi:hypothetical protein
MVAGLTDPSRHLRIFRGAIGTLIHCLCSVIAVHIVWSLARCRLSNFRYDEDSPARANEGTTKHT